MIPYGRQHITEADIEAVVEVLRSDWLTQGPMVPRFEQAVADYCGASHAVAVNSATSALHIACLALDLGPGDWLWTSPNTFVASANCGLYCGAKVDFVDIDPHTYNLCATKLAEKLEQAERAGRLPKVVIPVHFAGQPCDMSAIHALSQRYGFKIIEDASHAIGASYSVTASPPSPVIASPPSPVIARSEATKQSTPPPGSPQPSAPRDAAMVPVGACTRSHITVFSFHPVKIITTGEGGMALTNNPELAERMTLHRSHGITNNQESMEPRPADEIWNYQQIDIGHNYRMTDIQAALGFSQMQRLDEFVQRRHEIARHYDAAFAGLPVITPWQRPDAHSSYHLYPIRVRESRCGKTQRHVYDALREANVAVNLHYIPVYRQPYYEGMGFSAGYCPEAERFHKETISLPMYPTLKENEQMYAMDSIRKTLT